MSQIRKAQRNKAKLRLGIAAPSGAGKTYSALLLAFGLGGKVGIIDTENGSADLYADLGDYDVLPLQAPYEIKKYLNAISAFEKAGYDTIIIDSISHAWAGEGGLLDKVGRMSGNSYTNWRNITPEHNLLVEAMLQSPAHIIATMRSKTEYVLEENDKGKQVPKKVGMAPVQREGMDYEMTVMFDLDIRHNATTTKDRTGLFDGRIFTPSAETGKELKAWLESGVDLVGTILAGITAAASVEDLQAYKTVHIVPVWTSLTKPDGARITEAFKKRYADVLPPEVVTETPKTEAPGEETKAA